MIQNLALRQKSSGQLSEYGQVIPPELLWKENFNSKHSIQTYGIAVRQMAEFLGLERLEELREVNAGHMIAFKKHLQAEGKSPRTINNRLSAISSLFEHLIKEQVVKFNPVLSVRRFRINQHRVESKNLSPEEARKMMDAVDLSKPQGVRDRAILGILFFTGCRVAELCKLKVRDYYKEKEYWVLDFQLKGGKRNSLAIHPKLQSYLNDYFELIGHWDFKDQPLILPIIKNANLDQIRHLTTRQVERLWKLYERQCGLEGTTPHSARTTFITTAWENNCPIEKIQESVGHSQIATTQSYVHRVANYGDSASFSVRY